MVTPGSSAAVASRLLGRPLEGERAITVDQTNESVIVGDQVVVKWLLPPVLAPHAGVELLNHLAARGFQDMPRFLGVEQRDEMVLAVATEYLPGALDGWDWFVDEVDAWLQGATTLDGVVEWAARMGALTGVLHSALADLQRTTVAALDVDHLYLLKKDSTRALKLIPLIQVDSSPQSAKNACYFFNRLEREGGARFVSYHFTDKPEMSGQFTDATDAIKLLTQL